MTDRLEYNTTWLQHAIPSSKAKLAKCQRYERRSGDVEQGDFCGEGAFNTSSIVDCGQSGFVYKTDDVSIQNEVRFC